MDSDFVHDADETKKPTEQVEPRRTTMPTGWGSATNAQPDTDGNRRPPCTATHILPNQGWFPTG